MYARRKPTKQFLHSQQSASSQSTHTTRQHKIGVDTSIGTAITQGHVCGRALAGVRSTGQVIELVVEVGQYLDPNHAIARGKVQSCKDIVPGLPDLHIRVVLLLIVPVDLPRSLVSIEIHSLTSQKMGSGLQSSTMQHTES